MTATLVAAPPAPPRRAREAPAWAATTSGTRPLHLPRVAAGASPDAEAHAARVELYTERVAAGLDPWGQPRPPERDEDEALADLDRWWRAAHPTLAVEWDAAQ